MMMITLIAFLKIGFRHTGDPSYWWGWSDSLHTYIIRPPRPQTVPMYDEQ